MMLMDTIDHAEIQWSANSGPDPASLAHQLGILSAHGGQAWIQNVKVDALACMCDWQDNKPKPLHYTKDAQCNTHHSVYSLNLSCVSTIHSQLPPQQLKNFLSQIIELFLILKVAQDCAVMDCHFEWWSYNPADKGFCCCGCCCFWLLSRDVSLTIYENPLRNTAGW